MIGNLLTSVLLDRQYVERMKYVSIVLVVSMASCRKNSSILLYDATRLTCIPSEVGRTPPELDWRPRPRLTNFYRVPTLLIATKSVRQEECQRFRIASRHHKFAHISMRHGERVPWRRSRKTRCNGIVIYLTSAITSCQVTRIMSVT